MGLEKIGEIRKQKGLTLEELADKSGVPVSTIKKISAGITTNPNLDTVKALTKALGCGLDDLDNKENAPSSDIEPGASIEEILYSALLRMGYIVPGERMSKSDEEFLSNLLALTAAYFGKKKKESE